MRPAVFTRGSNGHRDEFWIFRSKVHARQYSILEFPEPGSKWWIAVMPGLHTHGIRNISVMMLPNAEHPGRNGPVVLAKCPETLKSYFIRPSKKQLHDQLSDSDSPHVSANSSFKNFIQAYLGNFAFSRWREDLFLQVIEKTKVGWSSNSTRLGFEPTRAEPIGLAVINALTTRPPRHTDREVFRLLQYEL